MKSKIAITEEVEEFYHAVKAGDTVLLEVSSAPYYHTVDTLELVLPIKVVELMHEAIHHGDAYSPVEHFMPAKANE